MSDADEPVVVDEEVETEAGVQESNVPRKGYLWVEAIEVGFYGIRRRWPRGYPKPNAGKPFRLLRPEHFSWVWMKPLGWQPERYEGVKPKPQTGWKNKAVLRNDPRRGADAVAAGHRIRPATPPAPVESPAARAEAGEPTALSQMKGGPTGTVDPNKTHGGESDPGSTEAAAESVVKTPKPKKGRGKRKKVD